MDSPSAPQAPDPIQTAQAQGTANADAARLTTQLNRPNQVTPYGTLSWQQAPATQTFDQSGYDAAMQQWRNSQAVGDNSIPGMPEPTRDSFTKMTPSDQWTSTITLDPRVQSIVDAQLGTSQGLNGAINSSLAQVNDAFGRPIDYSSMPGAPAASEAARKSVEDALYGRATSRLDPQFSDRQQRLESDLTNAGIPRGSEAWDREMRNFNFGRNDAYQQARDAAIAAGGQEQTRLFDLQARAHNDAISEAERKRALVLNELASLRNGQQVQMPQFSSGMSGTQVQPAPVAQSAYNSYQGNLNAYNTQVGANNSFMNGLFQLGSAAVPFMF